MSETSVLIAIKFKGETVGYRLSFSARHTRPPDQNPELWCALDRERIVTGFKLFRGEPCLEIAVHDYSFTRSTDPLEVIRQLFEAHDYRLESLPP